MNSILFQDLPRVISAILFTFLQTDPITPDGAGPTSKSFAVESFAEIVSAANDPERFWTAPFVLADLETRNVYVWGEHAGMISGDPLEFFVISENSGHDYEALMVAYAAPSDIHKALEKIGLEAGGPVDPDVHRFWPRGDRVEAFFLYVNPGDEGIQSKRAEEFCIWKGEPMPPLPWVFTGAPLLPSMVNETEMVYAPDEYSPNSIASTFNLRATVFDLPLQGSKTGVYGDFLLDPQWKLEEGRPMILRLAPPPDTRYPSEKDITLRFGQKGLLATGLENWSPHDLTEVAAILSARENEVHFLRLDFGNELTLTEATDRARDIQVLEQQLQSIRIEPPPPGQVFFQSFVPDPRFRERENRPSQPIELHLSPDGSATAMDLREEWGDSRTPTILETQVPLSGPQDWIRFLEERENKSSVLFLFAPPELTLGEMRTWTQPVLDRFPIIFLYKTVE